MARSHRFDETRIRELYDRESPAWTEFEAASAPWLLALFLRLDTSNPEDLVQETFLRVFTRIEGFRGEAAFSSWVHRIAMNVYIDSKRAQRSRLLDSGATTEDATRHIEAPSAQPDSVYELRELRTAVRRELGRVLNEKQLNVMIGRFWRGESHSGIAEDLGHTADQVKNVAYRAYIKLHKDPAFKRLAVDCEGLEPPRPKAQPGNKSRPSDVLEDSRDPAEEDPSNR